MLAATAAGRDALAPPRCIAPVALCRAWSAASLARPAHAAGARGGGGRPASHRAVQVRLSVVGGPPVAAPVHSRRDSRSKAACASRPTLGAPRRGARAGAWACPAVRCVSGAPRARAPITISMRLGPSRQPRLQSTPASFSAAPDVLKPEPSRPSHPGPARSRPARRAPLPTPSIDCPSGAARICAIRRIPECGPARFGSGQPPRPPGRLRGAAPDHSAWLGASIGTSPRRARRPGWPRRCRRGAWRIDACRCARAAMQPRPRAALYAMVLCAPAPAIPGRAAAPPVRRRRAKCAPSPQLSNGTQELRALFQRYVRAVAQLITPLWGLLLDLAPQPLAKTVHFHRHATPFAPRLG
jgi:hypothetical protein